MAAAVAPQHQPEVASGPHPATLTPHSIEEKLKFEDDTSSELSELDEDILIGDIEPDHYYENGKIPVFKPTMDQFRSFKRFIEKVDKYGMKSGIIKVIPPDEWLDSLPNLDEAVKTIKVKNPIRQEFNGNQGIYRQLNMEMPRSYDLPGWRRLCEQPHHQPPARRGERRRNQEFMTRSGPRSSTSTASPSGKRKGPGRPKKNSKLRQSDSASLISNTEQTIDPTNGRPLTPTSPETKPAALKQEVDSSQVPAVEPILKEEGIATPTKSTGPKSVSSRRKYNRREAAEHINEEAFKNFDYHIQDQAAYTPERCEELERSYWKGLTYSSPLYGADMPGSLFDDSTTSWNVAKLENLLNVLGQKVPGVNTAYLYLGMWKSTFAWHLEDVDLYSINYIHFGAPKQWYSISQEDARRFEQAMRNEFSEDAKKCQQFLRHKSFLISPTLLQSQYNIKVNKLVHHEREFVITFPYGYHSGYNIGYNCAESVNFATESWLQYGRVAKKCECESDSVWVDVYDIERKLRGEETEYEETDAEDYDDENGAIDLPTPPESVEGKTKPRDRKRKAGAETDSRKAKRIKVRVRIKEPKKAPCVLCPNDNPHEPLMPTDNGQRAHRLCALYIPETYIAEKAPGQDEVRGVTSVSKARQGLKCLYCRSTIGACFQCSMKKCARSFHPTCAAAAGVMVEMHDTPVILDDGVEYKDLGLWFRCKSHRPKRGKNVDGDMLEESTLINTYAKALERGAVIQAQFYRGEIFAGVVIENRRSENTILVDILPRGDKFEVEYKWVLAPDEADFQLPFPSADAKPMVAVEHRSDDMTPKQLPKADDPFDEPGGKYTWAEFESCAPPGKLPHAQVDFSKPEKLWYYIGEISTELRQKYSEDPQKRLHNPTSSFLDTVKPPPQPKPAKAAAPPRQSLPASYPSQTFHNPSPRPIFRAPQAYTPRSPIQPRFDKPYEYKPKDGDQYQVQAQTLYQQQASQMRQALVQEHCMQVQMQAANTHQHGSSPGNRTSSVLQARPQQIRPNVQPGPPSTMNGHGHGTTPMHHQPLPRQHTGQQQYSPVGPLSRSPSISYISGRPSSQGSPAQQLAINRHMQPSAPQVQAQAQLQAQSQPRPRPRPRPQPQSQLQPQPQPNSAVQRPSAPAEGSNSQQHLYNPAAFSPVGQSYKPRNINNRSSYQSPYAVNGDFTPAFMPFPPNENVQQQPQQPRQPRGTYSSYEQFWADCLRHATKPSPQSLQQQQFEQRMKQLSRGTMSDAQAKSVATSQVPSNPGTAQAVSNETSVSVPSEEQRKESATPTKSAPIPVPAASVASVAPSQP